MNRIKLQDQSGEAVWWLNEATPQRAEEVAFNAIGMTIGQAMVYSATVYFADGTIGEYE